jgi:predicted nucleic acid-binding protein
VIVGDASVVLAALTDGGGDGPWAARLLEGDDLLAPHLMPAEVAQVLRRGVTRGALSPEAGGLAYVSLVELGVALVPFVPYAARVWELRENVTVYDAWYVAVAEAFDCPLATLDHRLARAEGPRCEFLVPD